LIIKIGFSGGLEMDPEYIDTENYEIYEELKERNLT